jgi:hypothetical protein
MRVSPTFPPSISASSPGRRTCHPPQYDFLPLHPRQCSSVSFRTVLDRDPAPSLATYPTYHACLEDGHSYTQILTPSENPFAVLSCCLGMLSFRCKNSAK